MKNWNRILSTLLAALMLCTLLPVAAPAEEGIALDAEDAQIMPVDDTTLEDLKIVDGDELELNELGELNEELALDDNLEEDMPEVEDAPDVSNSFTDGDYDHDAFEIDDDGVLLYYHGAGGKVVIPDGVIVIGANAFRDCDDVTSIVIPEGVVRIEGDAFSNCDALVSVTVPSSVRYIEDGAFASCPGLKAINVSKNNPYYRFTHGALYDRAMKTLICCPGSVESYTIPNGVKTIGNYAFDGCQGLANLNIPKGVTSIGDCAFMNCCSLRTVEIPDGVTSIGEFAFIWCSNLKKVDIPCSVRTIKEHCFYECSSLTGINNWGDVNIPNSVTSIGSYAFAYCDSILSVYIPRSVTNIDSNAFIGCEKLGYVRISSRVDYIGHEAFNGCSALDYVTIYARDIEIEEDSFEDCSRELVIHAYANSYTYNWFEQRNFTVKPISDAVLLLKGNAAKKVQVGDKIRIALDGPKAEYYHSNNNNVAAVSSDGTLNLKKAGTAKITAKAKSGDEWELELKVFNAPTLSRTDLSLKKGKSFWLKVNGLFSGRKITWTSTNKNIATVYNGKVTAKKPGKCTIYAQVKNGVKLKCTVKVMKKRELGELKY